MEIISIDPSAEAVGIIRWKETPNALNILACTMPLEAAEHWLYWALADQAFSGTVLIERPAMGPGADAGTIAAYLALETASKYLKKTTLSISPGEWKPIARSHSWRGLDVWGPHATDAYLMLRYWRYLQNGK